MIEDAMAKKLLGGAANAVVLAADLARHVAWYVAYQLDGTPRDAPKQPPR